MVTLFPGDEPRVVILELVVGIPRALRLGAGLGEEARVAELRRTEGLIADGLLFELEAFLSAFRTLGAEACVAVPPVFPRPRQADRIDARVAEHARQGSDRRLIQVGLILVGVQRLPGPNRVPLRRPLAQPADRPRVVRVDLVVEPNERVPVGAILGNREVQGRPGRKPARPVRVVHLPLEAEEELGLVLDDRAADDTAPVASDSRRLRQIPCSDEIIRGRQLIAGPLREQHTLELVRPRLGDRVDDGAARAAKLRVIHAGQHLEFLDRLERGAHLRARAGAQGVVCVVAAVDRDIVVLTGLAGGDDRVVAHLVGRRELNPRQESDRRKEVAVHRGQLAQLLSPDVAADLHARRVNQRRLGRDPDGFLERAEGERHVDRQRLADRQQEAASLERPEACKLGRHTVTPGSELRGEIAAV